ISGFIGLDPNQDNEIVSGYFNYRDFCTTKQIPYHPMRSYSLSKAFDKSLLLSLEIDAIFVLGWQRLIPDWLLNHAKIGVFGGHGSPWGVEAGRGRSPQNWSIMME